MPGSAKRLVGFTESVIREMTRVAEVYDAINLSQGYPDFDPPKELIAAAHEALEGSYHQYATTWGAPLFREALAREQSRFQSLLPGQNDRINLTIDFGRLFLRPAYL